MKKLLFRLGVIVAAVCFTGTAASLSAQVDKGIISGVVQDQNNARIKGAMVTVKNDRTGDMRTTETKDDGSYIFPVLMPSTYTINVSITGFAPAEVDNRQVVVGQELRQNFTLHLASVSAEVTVTSGEEIPMDTTSARIGLNVTQREVEGLPLNGRQLSQLYLQSPGAMNSGTGTFQDIRFSGRAVEQNAIRYDGIEGSAIVDAAPGNLNGEVPSPFKLQSSLENVQEFRVESNNYPAEYGTGTGGQVSVVTKSGSNAFHGAVFEFLRNDALDAKNFFDFPGIKSKLRMNQFGASLGGPIVKDKLFFYGYYEGYRLRSGINSREAVPNAAVRSLPVCPAAVGVNAAASTTTCVDARIQPLLAGFIGPGAFRVGNFGDPNLDVYQLNSISTVNENSAGARFDYHINAKHSLYFRFFRDKGFNSAPEGVTGRKTLITAIPQNGVLSLTSVLTPTVVNEIKVGYNSAYTRINGSAPTINGVDYSAITINTTGSVANSGIAGQGSSSGLAVPGGLVRANSATNGRGAPYTPYTISFVDNVSWNSGIHTFKFGGEVRLVRLYTDRQGGTTYSFANLTDFVQDKISSVQYLGDVSAPSVFNNNIAGQRYLKQQFYVGYAQDEIKLRPNLTLNLGLRYEYYSVLHEDRGLYTFFDTTNGSLITPYSCYSPSPVNQVLCQPKDVPWYKASPSNFGPRVGLAWSPTFAGGHTVFRGGFGIFYGPGQAEDTLQPAESDRINSTFSTGATLLGSPVVFPGPAGQAAFISNVVTNFKNNPNNRQFQPRAYDPGYVNPERIYQYSASWQQQWGSFVSTVAYVGSRGTNLFLRSVTNRIVSVRTDGTIVRQFDIVDPTTGAVSRPYAEIDYKTSGGHDSYNALQTSLLRRFSGGLTLSTQYTFSKSWGNSAGSNEAVTTGNFFDFDYDTGYNNFDVRHSFNISALYRLPFGRGKGGLTEGVIGGWEVGTIVTARSGVPVPVQITRPDILWQGVSGTCPGVLFTSNQTGGCVTQAIINVPGGGNSRNVRRPDVVAGVDPFLSNGNINPAAFTTPKPGTLGNLVRNSIHGPNFFQADVTVVKRIPIREAMNVELRAEFFNVLNHPNFANPPAQLPATFSSTFQPGTPFSSATTGIGSFGKFQSTVGTTVGIGTNRQIQFGARFNF